MKKWAKKGAKRGHLGVKHGQMEPNMMPLKWSVEILNKAKQEGLVTSAPGYSHMLGRLSEFRARLSEVATYVYLPVPFQS